jgi:hypothetical protein
MLLNIYQDVSGNMQNLWIGIVPEQFPRIWTRYYDIAANIYNSFVCQ